VPPRPLTWIVGRTGLLGRSVAAVIDGSQLTGENWDPRERIPWDDEQAAKAALAKAVAVFLMETSARPWRILWCAGAGVIATSTKALEQETRVFGWFLDTLAELLAERSSASPGSFFLAASAGGVYGASTAAPPFDELSPTGALSPYGHQKLSQEGLAHEFSRRAGVPLLIGRISNLYGRGQDLSKPQGLVTHVGRAALRREPISIYVPLDTIRDYLLASDAGRMIVDGVARLERETRASAAAPRVTKIMASQVESSVATVLAIWRQVLKRNPRYVLSSSAVGLLQPRVLSFRSRVWMEAPVQTTSLPVGIHEVLADQLEQLRAGTLR
jgi:UDP-glucose 4-epimerase